MQAGHRPGRIVPKPFDELEELVRRLAAKPGDTPRDIQLSLDFLRAQDLKALRLLMGRRLKRGGPRLFVTQYLAPLATHVGEAWSAGELRVFEEHLFAEEASRALRGVIERARPETGPGQAARPTVAMATLSGEAHTLGLMMAEVILTLEGCACASLGAETPVEEFAAAVLARQVDIAAVSYADSASEAHIRTQLTRLRRLLPDAVEIWAGGATEALDRARVRGVRIIHDMSQATEAVAQWRAAALASPDPSAPA